MAGNTSSLLVADTDEEVKAEPVFHINPSRIKFNPNNPRKKFPKKKIQELADSIRKDGQKKPIIVFRIKGDPDGFRYMLEDGERRLRATLLLMEQEIGINEKGRGEQRIIRACIIEEKSAAEQLYEMFLLNFNHEQHTAQECAATVAALLKMGYSAADIAQSIGKPLGWVYQHRRLNDLAPEVHELMSEERPAKERLKFHTALPLASLPRDLQVKIAREIVDKGMSNVQAKFHMRTEAAKRGIDLGSSVRPDKCRASLTTFVANAAEGFPTYVNLSGDQPLPVLIAGLSPEAMKKIFAELVCCKDNVAELLRVVIEVGNRFPKFKGCVPKTIPKNS